MSQANAAAIKRRVNAPQTQNVRPGMPPPPQSQQNQGLSQNPSQTGLTLQQVISVIDKRLVVVETGLKEMKSHSSNGEKVEQMKQIIQTTTNSDVEESLLDTVVDEFNSRFEILAMEINNLKDIVLKLQTYTMSVNKTLLEERINILSDLGNSEQIDNIESEVMYTEEIVLGSNQTEVSENVQLVVENEM
jgi:Mg2+ and Co2+ transporter CorA